MAMGRALPVYNFSKTTIRLRVSVMMEQAAFASPGYRQADFGQDGLSPH
jgi:hypothetical protein